MTNESTQFPEALQPVPPPLPTDIGYTPLSYMPTPPPLAKPRVWTAIVVPILAILIGSFASGIPLAAAAISDLGLQGVQDRARFSQWVSDFGGTPIGFLMLILPAQLTFMSAALIAGAMSKQTSLTKRLGLVRPAMPWWAIPILLLATPFASVCGDLLTTAIFGNDRGEHLEMLYNLFRGRSSAMIALMVLAAAVLPGFGEELLFRGYMQRRLLLRWHPIFAIGLASLVFAGAHIDVIHVIGVWPLGVWLGVVAWLSRSVWPAMICHAANNAFAILATAAGATNTKEHVRLDAAGLTILGVTGAFVALSVVVMVIYRSKPSNVEPLQAPLINS